MSHYKLGVVDGPNYLFASYYTIAKNMEVVASTDVVNVFLSKLFYSCRVNGTSDVLVLWDDGKPEHRSKHTFYKANRTRSDDLNAIIYGATNILKELLPNIGIASLGVKGAEADDIAFYITNKLNVPEGVLLSSDMDWPQSLRENWYLYRFVTKTRIEYEDFRKDYDISKSGHHYLKVFTLCKALVGDSSDNIPGIHRCGMGTAKKLADKILNGEDIGTSGLANRINEHREQIDIWRSIIDMTWVLEMEGLKEAVLDAFSTRSRITTSKNYVANCVKHGLKVTNIKGYLDSTFNTKIEEVL